MGEPMGFTIFAVPKSFENPHIAMVQNNAIQSWKELGSQVEIILCSDDAGVAEAAERFGCLHIGDVRCAHSGEPLLDDVFARSQTLAANDIVAYVNADIMLFRDFAVAVGRVSEFFVGPFVMVGVRWDWHRPIKLNFGAGFSNWARTLAKEAGHKHNDHGMDYFVFRRGVFDNMKSFIIGWYAWDNALIQDIVGRKVPLVNATRDVFVVHQKHPERIRDRGKTGTDPRRLRNLELAGGLKKLREGGGGNIGRASWKLSGGKLKRTGR